MTRSSPTCRGGFSLIEMLIASVAASILALTAGTLLVLAWHSWAAIQESIEMQRDAATALTSIRNALHEATASEVAVFDGELRIRKPDGEIRYYQQDSDFFYDPNTATENDEMRLIAGRLHTFTPSSTNLTGRVTVTIGFGLFGDVGHETTAFTSMVALRN